MEQRRYTIDDWTAVKRALRAGGTIRGVAEATGVNRGAVFKWSRMDGPPDWMWMRMGIGTPAAGLGAGRPANARLTYEDRVIIFAMRREGRTHQEIAEAVGCHRTTVGRELARAPEGGYDPRAAQRDAERAARRPREGKLDANPRLRAFVVNCLMLRWSPEQIARRAREMFPDDRGMWVSHETIYRALYVQGKGSLRHELGVQVALRSGRKRRKPQSKLPARGKPWVEGREISSRPPEAADRSVPGHWEGDLVVGGDMSSCLITLIERRSRFLLMSRLLVHDAETVEQRLEQMVRSIPDELKRTLTWDQGSEMARVADFELATPFKVYFCDPHSPWERPTNENVNGLVREFFPKGTRFSEVTDEEVAQAQWLLNNRPRKVLGWKFPSEAMQEVLAEGATIG
ncbi:MAG: IS30 family transposase [Coriobacteriaceae bacterium]|nr:IS30 family transposase [Coriobacteriaceae bacterium]